MATVSFLYRSTKNEAFLNLRLLFRQNNIDYVFGAKTKFQVSKHYWYKQHNLKRISDIDVSNMQVVVRTELNNIEKHILNAFIIVASPETINKNWLELQINYYYNPIQETKTIPTDLISFIEYYIERRKDEVKPASITKFNVVKHKMERMQHALNKTIFIKDINEDFKNDFVQYYKSENYSQNTAHRELGIIKMFCKYAKAKGVVVHLELDSLKLNKGKSTKIYLTFDELEIIEKTNLENEYLVNARDWLIISCYTGQRISDFMRFTKEMIRIEDHNYLIEFEQIKTKKLMAVPLHNKVVEILKKRSGHFPRRVSDQRYNDYIKKVCEMAGLNEIIKGKKQINVSSNANVSKIRNVIGSYPKYELVSSHIGRRSFATNYYGYGRTPTTTLMSITGHSTEVMFLEYIGKSNKDLAMTMVNYF